LGPEGGRPGSPTQAVRHTCSGNIGIVKILCGVGSREGNLNFEIFPENNIIIIKTEHFNCLKYLYFFHISFY
jgi:hypothetical protein